ncbi:hypothetical protein PMAYCL1PPCAC_19073, partial [Pristionchus mayeri]
MRVNVLLIISTAIVECAAYNTKEEKACSACHFSESGRLRIKNTPGLEPVLFNNGTNILHHAALEEIGATAPTILLCRILCKLHRSNPSGPPSTTDPELPPYGCGHGAPPHGTSFPHPPHGGGHGIPP